MTQKLARLSDRDRAYQRSIADDLIRVLGLKHRLRDEQLAILLAYRDLARKTHDAVVATSDDVHDLTSATRRARAADHSQRAAKKMIDLLGEHRNTVALDHARRRGLEHVMGVTDDGRAGFDKWLAAAARVVPERRLGPEESDLAAYGAIAAQGRQPGFFDVDTIALMAACEPKADGPMTIVVLALHRLGWSQYEIGDALEMDGRQVRRYLEKHND